MPKLYEYFGLIVLFYSNEHEPVHVHGLREGRECRAELLIRDGKVVQVRYRHVKGRRPLRSRELADFKRVMRHFGDDAVAKWIAYFILHKPFAPQVISRRLP